MVAFRQLIRPGQSGRDVKAVKLAYRKLGVRGAGSMATTTKAGPAFVKVTKRFQANHGLHADGIYGKATHEKLNRAVKWTAYMNWLYTHAKKRHVGPPPAPSGDAQALAKRLLELHRQGKYRADNPGDLRDIQATAAGRAVWSQGGYWKHIDRRVFAVLIWLIEDGHGPIGTFAICSDHHYDGPHGHAGGLSVDVSTIKGMSVASSRSRDAVLAVMEAMHRRRPQALTPWQLICDGAGYQHISSIASLTIPSPGFYGYSTMVAHRNHVHIGYYR